MSVIDHASRPAELRGIERNIEHRTLVSHATGAQQMTLWDVRPPQGAGAPPHVHPHEETITVIHGRIKAQLDRDVVEVGAGQTLFIPAQVGHTFAVISEEPAHLLIAFPVDDPTWERIDWRTWPATRRD